MVDKIINSPDINGHYSINGVNKQKCWLTAYVIGNGCEQAEKKEIHCFKKSV